MDDELETPHAFDSVLDRGKIDISQEISSALPGHIVITRINHHFKHAGLGYRARTGDTFHLHVRSRKYPVFGTFSGNIHIFKKFDKYNRQLYAAEGLLEYRMSVLWFVGVVSAFFLLVLVTQPGFWMGVFLQAVGSGLILLWTYQLGIQERYEVEDRIENTFLMLRLTLQNLR